MSRECGVTHGDVQEVVGAFGEQRLIRGPQGERLEHISSPSVTLEHRVVDHITQI